MVEFFESVEQAEVVSECGSNDDQAKGGEGDDDSLLQHDKLLSVANGCHTNTCFSRGNKTLTAVLRLRLSSHLNVELIVFFPDLITSLAMNKIISTGIALEKMMYMRLYRNTGISSIRVPLFEVVSHSNRGFARESPRGFFVTQKFNKSLIETAPLDLTTIANRHRGVPF